MDGVGVEKVRLPLVEDVASVVRRLLLSPGNSSASTRFRSISSCVSRKVSNVKAGSTSAPSSAGMGTSMVKVFDGAEGGGVLRVAAGCLSWWSIHE